MKNTRRIAGWSAALCLLGGWPSAAAAAAQGGATGPRYGVAVYSDLCLDADSGDIGGQRISLQRYADSDSLFYEYTAGSLSLPVVASDVDIDDRTGVLTFNVAAQDGQERTVIGRFSERGRTLTLEGGYCADASMPMRLLRVSDFARPLKSCKACPPGQATPSAHAPAGPDAPPAGAPSTPTPPAAADAADDNSPTLEQQEQRLLEQRARDSVRELPPGQSGSPPPLPPPPPAAPPPSRPF